MSRWGGTVRWGALAVGVGGLCLLGVLLLGGGDQGQVDRTPETSSEERMGGAAGHARLTGRAAVEEESAEEQRDPIRPLAFDEEALRASLLSNDVDRIVLALREITRLGPKAKVLVHDVARRLEDRDSRVVKAAGDALMALGDVSVRPLIAAMEDWRASEWPMKTIQGVFIGVGQPSVQPITELLTHEWLYLMALRTLEDLVESGCDLLPVAPLILDNVQRAKAEHHVIQNMRAVLLLGEGAGMAVPRLVERLQDSRWAVRLSATRTLGHLGPAATDAMPHLRALILTPEALGRYLTGKEHGLARAAERALSKIRGEVPEPIRTVSR